jgi:hypothetical protein
MCHPLLHPATLIRPAAEPLPTALPPIDGVIEHATPDFLGVRTSDGRYLLIHAQPLDRLGLACDEAVR